MIEFLLESGLLAMFDFVATVLGEFGYRWIGNVLRAKATRILLSVAVGFGFGLAWGDRLSGELSGMPRLYFVSIAAGLAASAAAAYRLRRPVAGSASVLSPPWRWSSSRLAAFGLLNLAVAAGIHVGYSPRPG